MSKWNAITLTNAGVQMQNLIESGMVIAFTKVELGESYSTDNIAERTQLVSKVTELDIASVLGGENVEDTFCTVQAMLYSDSIERSFYAKELGLFAKVVDPEKGNKIVMGESLFAYTYDTVPDYWEKTTTNSAVYSQDYKIKVAVSNALSVTAVFNRDGVVTEGTVETIILQNLGKYIDRAEKASKISTEQATISTDNAKVTTQKAEETRVNANTALNSANNSLGYSQDAKKYRDEAFALTPDGMSWVNFLRVVDGKVCLVYDD